MQGMLLSTESPSGQRHSNLGFRAHWVLQPKGSGLLWELCSAKQSSLCKNYILSSWATIPKDYTVKGCEDLAASPSLGTILKGHPSFLALSAISWGLCWDCIPVLLFPLPDPTAFTPPPLRCSRDNSPSISCANPCLRACFQGHVTWDRVCVCVCVCVYGGGLRGERGREMGQRAPFIFLCRTLRQFDWAK